MGRPGADSGSSGGGRGAQQPQEYQFQAAPTQTPETIDDAPPPPPFEPSVDENQPPETSYENVPNNQKINGGPTPFHPPQSSKPNISHPQFTQTKSPATAGVHHHQPQAFPPAHQDHEPQAFPPAHQDHEPQAFPPAQDHKPQDFPPQFDAQKPQSFPPPQFDAHDQPQAFPPPQGSSQPHAFPPPQAEVHSFPPPQGQGAFQHQYHNYNPNVPNMGTNYTTGVGHSPMHHAMPNSPFVQPMNPQVNNNPPIIQGLPVSQALPTEPWKTDLFGCMDDPTNALVTACFPCVTFGQIAEIIDSGHTTCATSGIIYGCIACFIGVPCIFSCTYRTKLRGRYGLIETPAPDWIIHCFCEWCALCQEYRELQKRGLDPAIGWQGNLAKNQQMAQFAAMNPPLRQTMMG